MYNKLTKFNSSELNTEIWDVEINSQNIGFKINPKDFFNIAKLIGEYWGTTISENTIEQGCVPVGKSLTAYLSFSEGLNLDNQTYKVAIDDSAVILELLSSPSSIYLTFPRLAGD